MKILESTARTWLRNNNYNDIAELIEEWHKKGKGTRRNWWDILAGGKKGKSRVICGRVFPVIKAAQIRQGVPITENAICRNPNETPPSIKQTNRWKKEE